MKAWVPIAAGWGALALGCRTEVTVGEEEVAPSDLRDRDGDGYAPIDGDCDDRDPQVGPGAEERCDGRDQTCDGVVDEAPACTVEVGFPQVARLDLVVVVEGGAGAAQVREHVQGSARDLLAPLLDPRWEIRVGVLCAEAEAELLAPFGIPFAEARLGLDSSVDWLVEAVADCAPAGALHRRALRDWERLLFEDPDGLYRADAALSLLLVSNREDRSGDDPAVADLVALLDRRWGLDRVRIDGVVPTGACGEPRAEEHLALVDRTLGTAWPACARELAPFLSGVGQQAALDALSRRFLLPSSARPETLVLSLEGPAGLEVLSRDEWTYDADGPAVVLSAPPSPGTTVWVRYEALP